MESLDSFVSDLRRVVDVHVVETIYPAGEDVPGIEQGEVQFYTTTTPQEKLNRSTVEYRGLNHKATDLTLSLGNADPEMWTRAALKTTVEAMVERNLPDAADRPGVNAGVIISDSMLAQTVRELTPGDGRDVLGVTVRSTGQWPAGEMVSFIDGLQQDYLSEVL